MTQNQFSSSPYRQLRRSQVDRKIAGICGGVAEYFSIDPTLVRVAFIALAVLTGGAFLLAYVFALLVMPSAPAPASVWQDATTTATTPPPPAA